MVQDVTLECRWWATGILAEPETRDRNRKGEWLHRSYLTKPKE